MTEFVVIVFRLLNFGVLIALFAYFFKKYALQVVHIRIAQKESVMKTLQSQQIQLEQKKSELDQNIDEQMQECTELKKKMDQWNENIKQEVLIRMQEREHILKKITKYSQKRTEYYALDQIKKRVGYKAIEQTYITLKQQFSDEKKGTAFLGTIIKFVEQDYEA